MPLSFAQFRMWFLDRGGAGAAYHVPVVRRFSGEVSLGALEAALRDVMVRHEVLRTVDVDVEGVPEQRVVEAGEVRSLLVSVGVDENGGPAGLELALAYSVDLFDEGSADEKDREAPPTAREKVLCDLFMEILDVPQVAVNDNFFALGGYSLLTIRLVNRIRTVLDVRASVRDIFAAPTPGQLARRLDERQNASQPELRRDAGDGRLLPDHGHERNHRSPND